MFFIDGKLAVRGEIRGEAKCYPEASMWRKMDVLAHVSEIAI
jgi:hypothetical protein